jgi:nitrite reductase/ring-hydroxylating ferredoxin subunit
LSDGWLDGDIIECPLHGGQFNVRTGQALGDPVTCDLRRFPTRVRDGRIEVQVPEAP